MAAVLLRVAHADPGTAQAAFQEAEALRKQGKWAEACPFYQLSYEADPLLGALLMLAECHERIGRTASAWAEFNDAIELARTKLDPREAKIRTRADALLAKLARLHINVPKPAIPGLVIKRGTIDITLLAGGSMPVDPGEHELVASAPGYVDWKQKVTVAPAATVNVDVPPLVKIVVKPVEVPPPVAQEGTLKITTLPTAQIALDGVVVGTGSYEGKVKSGGHTLRVTADGMRTYQNEVFISVAEQRTIDVPLEKLAVGTVIVQPPAPPKPKDRPSFELGAGLQTGVKLRNDQPMVAAIRIDAAFRFGRRVNFGLFAEYGGIDTPNACGFDMPGVLPATPYDFGTRNQFNSCTYIMPGLQLLVHVSPGKRWDPFVGLAPGFRFGFAEWTPYMAGAPRPPQSAVFPGIVVGVLAGVDYHPTPSPFGWGVGAFLQTEITAVSDESSEEYRQGDGGPAGPYVSFLAGVRTSVAF